MGKSSAAKELRFTLPRELSDVLEGSEEQLSAEALEAFVVDLFRLRRIGLSAGARALGTDRYGFIQTLGRHRVPFVDYDEEEIAREVAAIEAHFPKG